MADLSGYTTEQLQAMAAEHPDAQAPDLSTLSTAQLQAMAANHPEAAAAKAPDPTEGMGTFEKLLAGIGGGMQNLDKRVQVSQGQFRDMLGLPGGGSNTVAAQQSLDEQNKTDAPLRATGAGGLGYTVPGAILTAPLAGVAGPLMGGAVQGAAQAATTGDNPLGGAAGGAIGGGIGSILGKLYNASRGAVNPNVLDLQALSQRTGVPLSAGDIGTSLVKQGDAEGGTGFANLENFIKHVPGSGRSGVLKQQAQGITGTAEGLQNLADQGAITTSNPQAAIAQDIRDEYARRSGVSAQNYAAARNQLSQKGLLQPVMMSNTTPAAQQLLTEFGGIANNPGIRQSARDSLVAAAAPVNGQAAAFDPVAVDKLRSSIMHIQNSGTEISPDMQHMLSGVKKGIDADEAAWAATLPPGAQGTQLLGAARDYHRTQVAPYLNSPDINALLDPRSTGQDILGTLGNARFGNADTLAGALSPAGKATLQSAMVSKLLGPAVGDKLQAGFSPSRIVGAMNIGDRMGQNQAAAQVLSPQVINRGNDLSDIANAARRSAGWANEHATGAMNSKLAVAKAAGGLALGGSAALATHGGALAMIPAARLANAASMSPAFQRYLYAQANSILPMLGGAGGASLFDQLGQ